MEWIKRNLFFVIIGAVALVLMVLAGVFAFKKYGEDQAVQEELNRLSAEWQRLTSASVFPNQENIELAKKEQKRLKEFRGQLEQLFAPAPAVPKMDDQGFKAYLAKTISDLTNAANRAHVALPAKDYSFTFTAHTKAFQFAPGSIETWMLQLADIKSICNILYQAKVNALDVIQRAPVSANDSGAGEFLAATIYTNQGGTFFAPYLISFRGFSPDLANVLEEMSHSTNCIIVKSVNVTPSTAALLPSILIAPPGPRRPVVYQQPAYRPPVGETVGEFDRYSGGKGGPPPTSRPTVPVATAPAPVAGRPAPTAATTVLGEKPLQITLQLEVLRLGTHK